MSRAGVGALLGIVLLMVQVTQAAVPLEAEDRSLIFVPGEQKAAGVVTVGHEPQLFIDDYLIESSTGVRRVVCRPVRDGSISNPIVTGKEDRCFQPYFSVSRIAETGLFRIWYGAATEDQDPSRSHLGYTESDDGVHWKRPARMLADPSPIQFGAEVIQDPSGEICVQLLVWWGTAGGGVGGWFEFSARGGSGGAGTRPRHQQRFVGFSAKEICGDGIFGAEVGEVFGGAANDFAEHEQ